ncbi:MAG: hypothetical protein MRY21_04150 [Simkaniaceae bacterium]|nr:hypothetical protein [Simkaniaceae bacterium]
MRFLYNFVILAWGLVNLPRLLLSKQKGLLKAKLGINLPTFRLSNKPVVWFHAVSLGETKAASPLVAKIRKEMPGAMVVFSTATKTGYCEAEKIGGVDRVFYLPLDLSWVVRRLVRRLKPKLFILVESDFWLNLLTEVKLAGGRVVLVNGKLSERSYTRHLKFPRFARRLFGLMDLLCVQNDEYLERLQSLGVDNVAVTGNLKFDIKRRQLDSKGKAEFLERLGIRGGKPVLTVGCSHPKEEELVLDQLVDVWEKYPDLTVLIAPRRPERFNAVAELITRKGHVLRRYSKLEPMQVGDRVMLIDAIGVLDPCYQVSDFVIMGGSLVPGVGGHNIFEPLEGGVCLFFGPYMETQEELVKLVLQAGAGEQIRPKEIASHLISCLKDPKLQDKLLKASRTLVDSTRGSTERCYKKIEKAIAL